MSKGTGDTKKKKIVSLEETLPKLKQQRKRKMYQRLIPLLLLFSCAILVVVYFTSPLSKVNQLTVYGTNEVTDQAVIDASAIRSGDSLWETFFRRKEIESAVKERLIQVESMSLTFDGLNSYALTIDEYRTVAYLIEDEQYYNILENGKIVDESRRVSIGNQPIFKNFSEGQTLDLMIEQYQLLNDTIHNSISEIEHTPTDTDDYLITIYMNDGNQVNASIPTFAEKMVYYPDIVQQIGDQKGIINIEVGVYFTPFDASDEPSNE